MSELIILEDCIPKTLQNMIEKEVLSVNFPWFFLENITFSGKNSSIQNLPEKYGFSHPFVSIERNEILPIHTLFFPVVACALDKLNLKFNQNKMYGGRLFLQVPDGNPNVHNNPHVDREEPHWVFLYYVNDSDGDTYFFKQTTKDIPPSELKMRKNREDYSDYEKRVFVVDRTIKPKQGTCVIFDGSIYHASSSPTRNKRCVVNFNYGK